MSKEEMAIWLHNYSRKIAETGITLDATCPWEELSEELKYCYFTCIEEMLNYQKGKHVYTNHRACKG